MAAEMWFYTSEGKQMDAVSMRELKRLVGAGELKPTDMVWKEGMGRWIRASSVTELFPEPLSALDKYFTKTLEAQKKAALAVPATPAGANGPVAATPTSTSTNVSSTPAAGTAKKSDDAESSRPPRRRPEPKSSGGSMGIIIVMVLAGLLLLGALLGGVAIILVIASRPGDDKKPPTEEKKKEEIEAPPVDPEQKYDIQIGPGQKDKKSFRLRAGVPYQFRVTVNEPQDPGARADLIVFHPSGKREMWFNPKTRNYVLNPWTPKVDADYQVEIENKSGGAMKAAIAIRDTNQLGKGEDPPPKDVREGKDTFETDDIQPGDSRTFKFRVKAGHNASISATVKGQLKGANFNLYVARENNANDLIVLDAAKRKVPHPRVQFNVPNTEIVQVRVENASKTVTNKCSIIFDVGR